MQKGEQQLVRFSPRESEIAIAVCRGSSNAAIADELGISEDTVKQHLKTIYDHLQIRSRMELFVWGLQHMDYLASRRWSPIEMHPRACACKSAYCSVMRKAA